MTFNYNIFFKNLRCLNCYKTFPFKVSLEKEKSSLTFIVSFGITPGAVAPYFLAFSIPSNIIFSDTKGLAPS